MTTSENVPITPGSGSNIAVDSIVDKDATGATINHQRVKIETGPDGVTYDANVYTPVPVVDTTVVKLLQQILIELRVNNALLIQNVDVLSAVDDYRNDERDALGMNTEQE